MKNLISVMVIYLMLPLLLLCAVQSHRALAWKSVDKDLALSYLLYQECPKESRMEAVKAQAVLLRSSLCLYSSEEWSSLLEKSTAIEQEKDYIEVKDTYYTAIEETQHLVLKYKGKTVRGVYHEISAGATRDGKDTGISGYSGFLSVSSNWDVEAPGYQQVFSFSENSLQRRFFRDQDNPEIKVMLTDQEGYVQMAQWGDTYVNGDYVRESLSLPSSCFSVSRQNGQWIFTCRGVGHGLGMSLYGSDILAGQGKTYREILQYYFPNHDILPE